MSLNLVKASLMIRLSGQYEDHYQGQSWQKILDGLQPPPEIKKVKNLHKFYMLVYWMLSSLTQPVKQFDGLILKAINAFVFYCEIMINFNSYLI